MGKYIMLVDEEPLVRKMVKCILSGIDYSILEAKDGLEAIDIFNINMPAIALLEANLPRTDGIKVCSEIKKSPSGKSTYVIMLSSLDDENTIRNAFKAGADDYILKPFNGLLLREKISNWLNKTEILT
jgi:two-component system, chemotaxis family, chemotaxis protein CheY